MGSNMRAISPPLPPYPAKQNSPPRATTSRDSVPAESVPIHSSSFSSESQTSRTTRSRTTSNAQPVIHQPQPQPIRDAVDKAFGQSMDQSPTTSHLDPSFIAQVTEAVVKNLISANVGVVQPSAPQSTASEQTPQSPVLSDSSLPGRYTPPSPNDTSKSRYGRYSTPDDSYLATSRTYERETSTQDAQIDGDSSDDAKLSTSKSFNSRRSSRYAGSIDTPAFSTRPDSQPSHKPGVPFATSVAPDDEPTTLEKAWQPLFNEAGKPTARSGQFLRGLALHLINNYEPKATLVVTPAKLLRFLEDARLTNEIYPWRIILGGSTSCASISTIYRRLLCEHHLVQNAVHEPPNLPGLTPSGFETFMTCLIQAHPDIEYERLSHAVTHLPISNADSPKERFPKELSRRLLPAKADAKAEQRLIASMAHEPQIRLRNSTSMPPPPPHPASAAPQQGGSIPERQRMPYARAPHSNAFDDDDLSGPSAPIERERKPYVAREGGGKTHTDLDNEQQPSQYRAEDLPYRPSRHSSATGSFSQSGNSPPEQRAGGRSRMNTGPGSQPPLSYNNMSGGRSGGRRSPPLNSSYSRSDVGTSEPSQYSHRMSAPNIDELRYNPRRTAASGTGDEDPRGKPIPLRQTQTQPTNGYDSGYGSGGMPPPLGASASSLPRQRHSGSASNSYDDRRKSAYAAGSAGIPEAWSSFADNPSNYPPRQGQANSASGPSGYGSSLNH